MPLFRRNRTTEDKPADRRLLSIVDAPWLGNDYGRSYAWDPNGNGAMRLSVVYGCVSRIANRISAMPLKIENEDENTIRPRWLDKPDPFAEGNWGLTMRDVVNQIVTSMLIDGNAFVAIGRSAGKVQEIQVINPKKVLFTREQGVVRLEVEHDTGFAKPSYDVLVVRNIVLPGEIRGISPVECCQRLIDVGMGSQEVATRYHDQALNLPGVITATGEITPEQTDMMLSQLQSRHGGSTNAHLPLILGQAKWESIGFDSQQAQFLEARHFTDAQITAHIFHLDPSTMGNPSKGSSDVYQNVELRSYEMLINALLPIMERIEDGLNELLPQGVKIKFDYDEQLRGDIGTRFRTYEASAKISKLLGHPLMTINEMREREGLPPVDGGDDMKQPTPVMMAPTDDDVDIDEMPDMSQNGKSLDGKKVNA